MQGNIDPLSARHLYKKHKNSILLKLKFSTVRLAALKCPLWVELE